MPINEIRRAFAQSVAPDWPPGAEFCPTGSVPGGLFREIPVGWLLRAHRPRRVFPPLLARRLRRPVSVAVSYGVRQVTPEGRDRLIYLKCDFGYITHRR
jgi:hypothetical protein